MMAHVFAVALLPLLSLALSTQPTLVEVKLVQIDAEKAKQMHWGCVNACHPGWKSVEATCVAACDTAMQKCIDPKEIQTDAALCETTVLKKYEATKIDALRGKKKEPKVEQKGKAFLQVRRNIDDDNAEAAEMARLEAQSDKDMGEDDDDSKTDSDEKSDDDESFVQVSAKKGDGFDGFGTPDPFNQNDDDQVDAGEPNAPEQENPDEDANMVSDDDADDDDSFIQVSRNIDDDNAEAAEMARLEAQSDKDMGEDDDDSKTDSDEEKSDDEESFVQISAKKGDGFDGFGTPDPFNQNDDDQVDAGEPNAPDQENPNDDANMVSDDDADDDDSFVQVSRNIDDDNAEAAEMARLEAQSDKDMGEDDDDSKTDSGEDKSDDEESFVQVSAKKGDGFDGFGTPDPFNQNDDDQVDAGEPNAPDQENPNDDANMVSDDDSDDDDSFIQVSRNIDDDNTEAAEMAHLEAQSDKDMGEDDDDSKTDGDEEKSDDEESFVQVSSKKGDGFDGFGTPDPFNQNDDDQVDAGEPNAPDQENPNDDANMVSDDDADDDDSFIQVSRNIDDDNAEAAEMARLEAQSDKDMGEDDDESKTSEEQKFDEQWLARPS